jgi:Flp pilus assembly protein TadG
MPEMMMGCVSFSLGMVWGKGARNEIVCRPMEDESGASAIEYGLIAALVAIAAIGAMQFSRHRPQLHV